MPVDENFTLEDYENLNPVATIEWHGKKIHYCVPTRHVFWRFDTLKTKERDTIDWIAGFAEDAIFADIGANVGMYTIWAAATAGVRVFAFEPESQNFALLNRNIIANDLGGRITAYCVALNDKSEFGNLFLSSFVEGGSCHNFGESVNFHLKPMKAAYRQGCFSVPLDQLIANGVVPCPTYIKIDVDGNEHKVITGAAETLKNEKLKSVLVELNTNLKIHRELVGHLTSFSFVLNQEYLKVGIVQKGPFKGVGNHIFQR